MRTINFTEKDVTIRQGHTIALDKVSLIRVSDSSSKIIAIVKVFVFTRQIILWEGVSYKPLNEWTEQEIDNRIIELI